MSSFVSPADELAIFWERRFTVVQARPRGKSENGVYYPKSLLSWEFWPNFLRLGDQVYYLAKVYYLSRGVYCSPFVMIFFNQLKNPRAYRYDTQICCSLLPGFDGCCA